MDAGDLSLEGPSLPLWPIKLVGVVLLGLLPGPLMALCVAAIRSAWHLG